MTKFASHVAEERGANWMEMYSSGFERARAFHEAFNLPVNTAGYVPTVEDRVLRGKLLIEEVIETLTKGLGLQATVNGMIINMEHIQLMESELHPYDPVETLDGLADVKVIANGTAVVMGLPMEAVDYEVFCSNMSKLDADGKPIINGVTPGYRADPTLSGHAQAEIAEPGFRPDQPIGKVLKPDNYVPANIAGLLGLS